jgi:hypothetical protein
MPAQLRLDTSYFTNRDLIGASGLTPVRTSLGYPRFRLGYDLRLAAQTLMPQWRLVGLEEDEYRAGYRKLLDERGLDAIRTELTELWPAGSPGPVLLCFEKLDRPDQFCHRVFFSELWREWTGQTVPELATHSVPRRRA